jgi:hypothetical protein
MAMRTLAEALLLQWWFLEENEEQVEEAFGDDFMMQHHEDIGSWAEEMSAAELRAMEKAARDCLARRLALPDEWGFTSRKLVSDKEREFFESFAKYFAEQAAEKE